MLILPQKQKNKEQKPNLYILKITHMYFTKYPDLLLPFVKLPSLYASNFQIIDNLSLGTTLTIFFYSF